MLTQVLELALLRIVQLRALDDHCVRGEVDAPRQRGSRAQHLSICAAASANHATPTAAIIYD